MKAPNYTPAPWTVHSNNEIHPQQDENGLKVIADVGPSDCENPTSKEETAANTQLIAAAPDLAESLADLLYLGEQMELESGEADPTIEKARQALIKAGYTL